MAKVKASPLRKTIEIRTTQNVTISYELAYPRERILAWALDVIFIIIIYLLLAFLINPFRWGSTAWEVFIYTVPLPILTFYTLIQESLFNGQTMGKMILRIRVVKLNGKQPTFIDYLLRWSLRFLDIWLSAGSLAVILTLSTDHSQRLGEMISNTAVVRVRNRAAIELSDILRIDTRSSYEPQYPEIRNFREEDIVLMKTAMDRYNKYKNAAHREALSDLCRTMSEKLGLAEVPAQPIQFLRTLIKDYIVLTR